MTPPFLTINAWRKTALNTLLTATLLFSPLSLGQTQFEKPSPENPGQSELTQDRDAKDVAHLLGLISRHYQELEESKKLLPSAEELALRDAAQLDAAKLAQIPFSADKVRLNGSEGNTALARMSQRLSDNTLAESRRDIALLCSIKTRLFGTLIASETRSLTPAGKNQYIARVRLQPGESTLRVGYDSWKVSLPRDMNATDYLITLYAPADQKPEFHIFSVTDLLAEKQPHIPAWLPAGIDLNPTAG